MLESSEPPSGTAPSDHDALAWRMAKLRRYDLNLLLSLHALLHTRNVTQAGDWLGVTQPAMSSDLRRLRQMFKDELLVRYGREYQLTALASALVEPLTRAPWPTSSGRSRGDPPSIRAWTRAAFPSR